MPPLHLTQPTFATLVSSLSSTTSLSTSPSTRIFARTAATARRQSKALRPRQAPSAKPSSKYAIPSSNQIVFNPPPSAPSPYHTPPIFLPPEDPRRALLIPSHAHSNPYGPPTDSSVQRALPPPIKAAREKTYHLSKDQIDEMRALRRSNEWEWTRKRLAEKFGCTEFFVGMTVQAGEKRMEWAKANLERTKERWGDRRRGARVERSKRRELWGRDA